MLGDICEPDFMRYILQEERIDTVLHFAAQSHVGEIISLLTIARFYFQLYFISLLALTVFHLSVICVKLKCFTVRRRNIWYGGGTTTAEEVSRFQCLFPNPNWLV